MPKLSLSPSVPTATHARAAAKSIRTTMTRRDPSSVVPMGDTATTDAYTDDTMHENTNTTARSFQNDRGSADRVTTRPLTGTVSSL